MMNKAELNEKIVEINTKLNMLGNLKDLISESENLPELSTELVSQKEELSVLLGEIPEKNSELTALITQATAANAKITEQGAELENSERRVEELEKKVNDLIGQTKIQLGVAANAKLASTFEKVKESLRAEKEKMFKYLIGSVIVLILVTAAVVFWQVKGDESLYHLNFLIRIALLSPVVYFVVFINSEYNRLRNLIEEYTFKAAIARSFEAYREIVEGADTTEANKTLEFVLSSISDLYSSPMKNIKEHGYKKDKNSPDLFTKVARIAEQEID